MAKVDYDPVPSATPELQAPDDYQRVQASPTSFGAPLAEGAEAVGQGALKASDFYGQVAADNSTNNFLQERTKLLYGDPNKTVIGPDGQPTPDTGFFGLRGADALRAAPEVSQELQEQIAANREGLTTPQAKLQYDTETRRYLAQTMADIGNHTDKEQRTWATDTNTTVATLALNQAARSPTDPAAVSDAQERTRQAYAKNAQLAGEDPQGAVLKADQDVAMARIRSLVVSNPVAAQKVLDDSQGVLGSRSDYDQISRGVKEAVINAAMAPATDRFVADTLSSAKQVVGPATPGAAPSQTIAKAILTQESRNNPNAPTSVTGATGIGQIEPATFAAYAKPGENITNPHDNAAVANRIVQDYTTRYNGDAARVAVAYFSGPGNVAPAGSSTPWIQDRKDPTGKSTSSYVADVESRLSKYPSTADALNASMADTLDKARSQAEQLFPNYPDAQERFVSGVERRLDQTISQQHQQYEVQTHIVQSVMAGPNPPISEDQLMAVSPRVAAAWTSMQFNNPYAALSVERMFDANAKGRDPTYGANFKDYLDRVLAPSTDTDRIANPSQLWPYVGSGADAPVTNTGVNELSNLLQARGTPQGEAFAAQARTFLDNMHAELTYANKAAGSFDPKGEALFNRFAAQALPILETAYKNGSVAKVLDPKSPDYLGNLAQNFARTPAQIMKDRLFNEDETQAIYLKEAPPDQGRYLLKEAVSSGRLTMQQATEIGEAQGWFAKAPASPSPDTPAGPPLPEAAQFGHTPGTEPGGQ